MEIVSDESPVDEDVTFEVAEPMNLKATSYKNLSTLDHHLFSKNYTSPGMIIEAFQMLALDMFGIENAQIADTSSNDLKYDKTATLQLNKEETMKVLHNVVELDIKSAYPSIL